MLCFYGDLDLTYYQCVVVCLNGCYLYSNLKLNHL